MKITLVAAVARNGVIGRGGAIPWTLSEDLAHFRELTMGHPVIMGRRTWDSLPDRFRPLPGRRNVVLTRNSEWNADEAERAGSFQEALELLGDATVVFVIGGADVYSAALPIADELALTEVDEHVEGDTYFPSWDRDAFDETAREPRESESGMLFSFVTYSRRETSTETSASRQLSALAAVAALFDHAGIAYWLFGGWAVDFYAGSITRPHDDVDITVWLDDLPRISALLEDDGWRHDSSPEDDGGTGYERGDVRLELTYLLRDGDGRIVTPLRDRQATWADGAFSDDERELLGVRSRLIGLAALTRGKSSSRDDPDEAAKDRADFDVLSDL